jgi:hypothetical protein
VSLDIADVQADGLAERGNRIVQLSLHLERVANAAESVAIVGLEADRLAVLGDRLILLSLLR